MVGDEAKRKQFATYTKYYGDLEAEDQKSLDWRKEATERLHEGVVKAIRRNHGRPRNYNIEYLFYQSFEDGDAEDRADTPQGIMGAVYFPEPIFANSVPVVLIACVATEKVAT